MIKKNNEVGIVETLSDPKGVGSVDESEGFVEVENS
jgi:hypothetical protein